MTKAKKVNLSTKLKKLLSNPKNVVLIVFLLGFAGIGGYWAYNSSSAGSKNSANVNWCNYLIQNNKLPSMKIGSEGVCVTTLGRALNGIRTVYSDQGTSSYWGNINYSAIGKTDAYDTTYFNAVKGFQTWQTKFASNNIGPSDGIAGKLTWGRVAAICNGTGALKYQCGLDL